MLKMKIDRVEQFQLVETLPAATVVSAIHGNSSSETLSISLARVFIGGNRLPKAQVSPGC
jgi:hypothetical protein